MAIVRLKKATAFKAIMFIIIVMLGAVAYFLAQGVQKTWDDQSTWHAKSGVTIPTYDLSQFKVSLKKDSSGNSELTVDYCLLLNSVNTDSTVSLRCSLLPRALATLDLFDPYRWMPENGIEIVVSKDKYPASVKMLRSSEVTFDSLQVAGMPVPVSLKVVYSESKPKATIASKLSHYLEVKSNKKTDINTKYVSIQIDKVKEYSELSDSEKKVFGEGWTKKALKDFEERVKITEKTQLEGQELLNSIATDFRPERFVCTVVDNKVSCIDTLDGNPAESVLYYSSLKNSLLGQKVAGEFEKRMYPFVPKGSEFQVYCTQKLDDPNCKAWSEMMLYQYPYCPFNELIVPNSDQKGKDIFMKYSSYWKTPTDLSAKFKTFIEKFNSQGRTVEQLNNSDFFIISKQYCKYALEKKIPFKELDKNFLELVDFSLFRNAAFYNEKGELTKLTMSNLSEGLYNSSTFSPYKFSFVSDSGTLAGALKEGYSREKLESSLGNSYNLYATIVALYIMQGRYGN